MNGQRLSADEFKFDKHVYTRAELLTARDAAARKAQLLKGKLRWYDVAKELGASKTGLSNAERTLPGCWDKMWPGEASKVELAKDGTAAAPAPL